MKTSLTARSYGSELHIGVQGASYDIDALAQNYLWQQFVPGLELESGITSPNPNLSVLIDDSVKWTYNHTDHSLQLPAENIPQAIVTAGYMLDAKRQENGLYTLHGNIIAGSEKTLALLGPISGIGKTSLSAFAAENDWQWVADEKFVIDESAGYIGSTPGILNDAKTRINAGESRPDATVDFDHKIGGFIVPIVAYGTPLTAHKYSHDKAFWHLYDEMSRDVRMTPFILDGPNKPLPSFDNDEISVRRRQAAEIISRSVPFIFVMGSREAILEYASQQTA